MEHERRGWKRIPLEQQTRGELELTLDWLETKLEVLRERNAHGDAAVIERLEAQHEAASRALARRGRYSGPGRVDADDPLDREV